MTIRQNGGVFGRNPAFNDVTVEGDLTVDGTLQEGGNNVVTEDEIGTIASQDANNINIDGGTIDGTSVGASAPSTGQFTSVAVGTSSPVAEDDIRGVRHTRVLGGEFVNANANVKFELCRFSTTFPSNSVKLFNGHINLSIGKRRAGYNNNYNGAFIDAAFGSLTSAFNFNTIQVQTFVSEHSKNLITSVGGTNYLTSASLVLQVSYNNGSTWVAANGSDQGNVNPIVRLIVECTNIASVHDRWGVYYSLDYNNANWTLSSSTIVDIT